MLELSDNTSSGSAGFKERVQTHRIGESTVLLLPVSTPDIVSFQASRLHPADFAAGDGLLRDLVFSMLDKGTQRRSKIELAEALEGMGAQLSISTDGVRVRVSGQSLRRHLPQVLGVLGEQMMEPVFPVEEFEMLKARYQAALTRSMSNTAMAASGALSRNVYSPDHPNYSPDPVEEMERLPRIALDTVREYFENRLDPTPWNVAVVGDVSWEEVEDGVTNVFGFAGESASGEDPRWQFSRTEAVRKYIRLPDRDNLDVRIGHAVDMTSIDPAYLPLYVGNYVLGGNFSARLMSVIRDEMGLTYGIRSSLSDVDALHHGMWSVSVTLSQDNLETGVEETMKQLREFVLRGISEEELAEKKTTLTGSFKVGMSSTSAIAGSLLRNAEKERSPEYLDSFPERIEALTVGDVNERIGQYLRPDSLHMAVAGSIPG